MKYDVEVYALVCATVSALEAKNGKEAIRLARARLKLKHLVKTTQIDAAKVETEIAGCLVGKHGDERKHSRFYPARKRTRA